MAWCAFRTRIANMVLRETLTTLFLVAVMFAVLAGIAAHRI